MAEQDLPVMAIIDCVSNIEPYPLALVQVPQAQVMAFARAIEAEATATLRTDLAASRAKFALLAAEVEGLRAGLQDIANLTSVEIDMCLLMPVTMAGKTLAAAAPNQGEAG